MRLFILAFWLFCFFLLPGGSSAAAFADDDEINLHCLKQAYPEIRALETTPAGQQLLLDDGRRIPYSVPGGEGVKESMAQIYPLEPVRGDTPPGFAPGRIRPYALLDALYGADAGSVRAQLVQAPWLGKRLQVSKRLAKPLAKVAVALRSAEPGQRRLLAPDGGFVWRKIAGENRRSPHSWGIAIDIGAKHAPYWRWSRNMPHPMQASYPAAIVRAFEDQGFIWGGKWHEYDLMHFEYRPELICKARYLRDRS